MKNEILKNTKISEYLELLKVETDQDKIKDIDAALSSAIPNSVGGFDMKLFQMNKDLLVFYCKFTLAMLNFDEKKQALYSKRIDDLRKQLKKREKSTEKIDQYASFLQWLLSLKKYYGSDIDLNNDLYFLVEATKRMMKYYTVQENSIEQNSK